MNKKEREKLLSLEKRIEELECSKPCSKSKLEVMLEEYYKAEDTCAGVPDKKPLFYSSTEKRSEEAMIRLVMNLVKGKLAP